MSYTPLFYSSMVFLTLMHQTDFFCDIAGTNSLSCSIDSFSCDWMCNVIIIHLHHWKKNNDDTILFYSQLQSQRPQKWKCILTFVHCFWLWCVNLTFRFFFSISLWFIAFCEGRFLSKNEENTLNWIRFFSINSTSGRQYLNSIFFE